MRAVIAVPVSDLASLKFRTREGWPESFTSHAEALSRQVSRFGNKSYASAKTVTIEIPDKELQLTDRTRLVRAVVISKPRSVIVLVAAIETTSQDEVLKLRRLSLSENKELWLEKLGVILDDKSSVYGLSVAESNNQIPSCKDGHLLIPASDNSFVFDVIYMQTLGALAFEREVLELSTVSTFKPGFLNLRALRHLGEIKHWLSYPSSDSTRLYQEIEILRSSLKLDSRKDQVLRSLEQHTKRLNYSATVLSVSLGISLSLADTLFLNIYPSEGIRLLSCVLLSLTTASLTWLLARS